MPNNNGYHAFLYDGTLRDLGTLGGSYSNARAVKSAGQVVGDSNGAAFLYSGGVMRRLIDLLPAASGWTSLWEAIDIR